MQFMAWIGHQGGSITGITAPTESDRMLGLTLREPLGVVGLITPWNFPFNIPSWKLGSSLICGNTVVLKPAQLTPLCAIALVQALARCRAPRRRRQPRPRLRPGGGGDDGDRPAREGDLVHRLDGGRDRHQRQGGRARQEGAGRDGRPQRRHRARGRRPRAGGEGLRDGRLRDDRTALHGAAADHRGAVRSPTGSPSCSPRRRGRCRSARATPTAIRHRSDGRRGPRWTMCWRRSSGAREEGAEVVVGGGRRGERGRLLPRADAPREGRPLDDDRERGGVRPGASGHGGRRLRRGARRRDLDPLRALGLDLHERPERCDPLHAGDGRRRRARQQAPDRRRESPARSVASRSRASARRSSARWPTSTRRRRPSTSTTPEPSAQESRVGQVRPLRFASAQESRAGQVRPLRFASAQESRVGQVRPLRFASAQESRVGQVRPYGSLRLRSRGPDRSGPYGSRPRVRVRARSTPRM